MSWNYRIVRYEGHLRVYDIYYNEEGRPIARHEAPTYLYGDSVEELEQQLDLIKGAFQKPILDDSEIGTDSK